MTMFSDKATPIQTVAAVITDNEGRVGLVRKRGTGVYIQPGGKPEAGEQPQETLARELREELGVELVAIDYDLGQFKASAVHEINRKVHGHALVARIAGNATPQGEIEELRWFARDDLAHAEIAPLSREHILPAFFDYQRQQLDPKDA